MLSLRKETIPKLTLLIFFSSWFFTIDTVVQAQQVPSGYSLNGTIQSSDLAGAVITVSKGEQTFFRKFEKLPDGSQIVEVRRDSVVLKRPDGTTYEMYVLHETKTVASAQPTQTVQPGTRVDPYTPGSIRSAPGERPLSSAERHRGRRRSDSDNQ